MNTTGGSNMSKDVKKRRAKWLDQKLTDHGYQRYGRATEISKTLSCGMSSIQGWMRGSLPRDLELAHKFCKQYKLDLVEWISLEQSELGSNSPKLEEMQTVVDAVLQSKEFEESLTTLERPHPLNSVTFVKVFQIILKSLREPGSSAVDSLDFIHSYVESERAIN
jgi:hypothetical protein